MLSYMGMERTHVFFFKYSACPRGYYALFLLIKIIVFTARFELSVFFIIYLSILIKLYNYQII